MSGRVSVTDDVVVDLARASTDEALRALRALASLLCESGPCSSRVVLDGLSTVKPATLAAVGRVLRSAPSLTVLTVSNVFFGSREAVEKWSASFADVLLHPDLCEVRLVRLACDGPAVLRVLEQWVGESVAPLVESLCLEDFLMSPDALRVCLAQGVKRISFRRCGPVGTEYLDKAFAEATGSSLESLVLQRVRVDCAALDVLHHRLPVLLRRLDLSDTGLDGEAARGLAALAVSRSLEHLGLADNPNFSGHGFQLFCSLASSCTSLRTLSVGGISLSRHDLIALTSMLESVGTIAELNLSRIGMSQSSLAVLLHYLRSEACSLSALDLSGNPLHALSNFSDIFAALALRTSTVTWLSVADCGLDKGDAEAIADFLEMDPELQHLDLSGSSFGNCVCKLGPALGRNNRLRSLSLHGCGVTKQQCETLFATIFNRCFGLCFSGLPSLPPPSPTTLVVKDLSAIAATALSQYSAVVVVDGTEIDMANSTLAQMSFLGVLKMQRCLSLGKRPLQPRLPMRHLRSLSLHACGIRDMSDLLKNASLFPVLEELSLSSNRIRSLGNYIGGLLNLQALNLRCNELQDLPIHLCRLSALRHLDLSFNPLGGMPSFVSCAESLQGRPLAELLSYLEGLSHQNMVGSMFLRVAVFSANVAQTHRLVAEIRPAVIANQCLRRAMSPAAVVRTAAGYDTKRGGLRVASGASSLSSSPSSPQSLSGGASLGRRGAASSGSKLQFAADSSLIVVDHFSYPEGLVLDNQQRVEMRLWHSARSMQEPQLVVSGPRALYVWVLDAAQYVEDAASVTREIVTWTKLIEVTAGKAVQMFIVAISADDSFERQLPHLQSSLRSLLPHPAPEFSVLSQKGSPVSLVRAMAGIAQKKLLLGAPVPAMWCNVAESLESQFSDELQVHSVASFAIQVEGYGVEMTHVHNLLRFLHDVGAVWWFNVLGLQDFVFVNPPTVIGACMKQLDVIRCSADRNGIVSGSEVKELQSRDLSGPWRGAFVRLACHMGLLFELNEGRLFLPCALSANTLEQKELGEGPATVEYSARPWAIVAREYHFLYVPDYFFHQFCVKVFWFGDVTVRSVWKSGLELVMHKDRGTEKAAVSWDPLRFVLNIEVESHSAIGVGSFHISKGQLLRFLTETVEDVARGCFKAKFSVRIPCNHCLQDPTTRSAPYHFAYQAVIDALMSNSRSLPCQGLKSRQVLIASLCPDLALADISRNQIFSDAIALGDILGKGGFATVYRAMWKNRQVAVKQMHACHSQQDFSEFQREAWIMGGLQSPYLVKLLGVCLEPPMLVMELLHHGSLYSFLRERNGRPLSRSFRLQIALDIAMGMSVLESSVPPLIHRDLKSPNILMVTDRGESEAPCCKVTDFGLSKQLFGNLAARDVFNPDWLAPEIMLNQPYTMSSDVFSYGIILWELVALQHPFDEYCSRFLGMPDALKEEAIANQHLRPSLPPAERCEPWFAKLITSCWDPVPDSRPTFRQVVIELLDNPEGEKLAVATSELGTMSDAHVLRRIVGAEEEAGEVERRDACTESVSNIVGRGHDLQRLDSFDLRPSFQQPLVEQPMECKVSRRVLLPSLPTTLELTRGELFWVGLCDGSLATVSARVGTVLNVLKVRNGASISCLGKVQGKIWVGCSDGFLASVSLSSVMLDVCENRVRSEVRAICPSWQSASPGLVAFADGTVCLVRADLQGPVATMCLSSCSARAMCVYSDGDVLAFVGDAQGTVWVLALPDLLVRGSFSSSTTRSAVTSLSVMHDVLWVGLESGTLALFRIGGGISAMPSRLAHRSALVAVIPFTHAHRVCSLSRNGHLCWWSSEDNDLEWENKTIFEHGRTDTVVSAAIGMSETFLAVCETGKSALALVNMFPNKAERLGAPGLEGEVEALLRQTDPETRLYVLVQRYRQSEMDERRVVAKSIQAHFFARSACPPGLSRQLFAALKEELAVTLSNDSEPMPGNLFDGLATAIFARKRSSIADLTKTVFMDLCAKGIELRALTYDEGLLECFSSLCDNYDNAAWEEYSISTKSHRDGRKIRVPCWKLREAVFENGAFTGKCKVSINVPEHVLLALVSRPEHKVRWEKALSQSEMVKEFSSDFFVVHSVYVTPALSLDRDAVMAYLTTRHNGNLVAVGRSVPYGNVPVPPNHVRLVVDISGFQIQKVNSKCCVVTQLVQLREIRKANVLAWSAVRRKRMAALWRLKEYAEAMDAEQMASFALYKEQGFNSTTKAAPPPTSRLELGQARTTMKKV